MVGSVITYVINAFGVIINSMSQMVVFEGYLYDTNVLDIVTIYMVFAIVISVAGKMSNKGNGHK